MGYNNGVPVSNKTWRKTHYHGILRKSYGNWAVRHDGVLVDKNNHKQELVVINDHTYRVSKGKGHWFKKGSLEAFIDMSFIKE